ncbi:hypothetical protein ACSU1N_02795 [Thermogladius sp. 4427co]|uniref:hypothetical protein n=1 Tax=Thermogladius sp. 4427co TaxID=3450718 RepID=UPI003F7A2307
MVEKYIERWMSITPMLDPCTREIFKEVLRNIDMSTSLLSYRGVVDPLEVIVFHLVLEIAGLRKSIGERGYCGRNA